MKFTIITVVYNSVKTIERTIKSVISQRDVEYQYIIIDGNSIDGTRSIIEKYIDNIDCYISEPDKGIYDAMNKALSYVNGDVVSFINGDDWYEENALKTVETYFDDVKDIIYGNVFKIEKGEKSGYICWNGDIVPDDLHYKNIYCHQGLFIRKKIFDEIGGFNLKYKIVADYDWNLRAYNAGYRFYCIPEVIANFSVGGFSTTELLPEDEYEVCIKELNGRDEYISRIEARYNLISGENAVKQLIKRNDVEYIKNIIDKRDDIYIWGAGKYGELCFNLLEKNEYIVKAFIDADINKEISFDINILSPDDVAEVLPSEHYSIIITPWKYEKEIVKFLCDKGVDDNNIVLFSDIRERARLELQQSV